MQRRRASRWLTALLLMAVAVAFLVLATWFAEHAPAIVAVLLFGFAMFIVYREVA
jgi:fatty acid desaturase